MSHNTATQKVFFSRAIDGINPDDVIAQERSVCDALASLGMSISNPFRANDVRRNRISGINEIVEDDLSTLANSDIVLADLSIPKRSYIGAIFELAHAYELGKQIYVWVGRSGNENRTWLKYYADAICKDFDDVIEILHTTFTHRGRKRNEREVIAYYSTLGENYGENKNLKSLVNTDTETIKKYIDESQALQQWVQALVLTGTIIDLGSGNGRWIPIWAKKASRVVCVDASIEMLKISRRNNNFPNVEHIQGNFLETKWLKLFLNDLGGFNVIVLGFVLNLLTLEQEKEILAVLRHISPPGTRLILLENQSSIFSTSGYFSRTEIQHRNSPNNDQLFRIYKRNFLPHDVRRVLHSFGNLENMFYTNNYFISGMACASEN